MRHGTPARTRCSSSFASGLQARAAASPGAIRRRRPAPATAAGAPASPSPAPASPRRRCPPSGSASRRSACPSRVPTTIRGSASPAMHAVADGSFASWSSSNPCRSSRRSTRRRAAPISASLGGGGGIRTPGAFALRFSRPSPSTTRPLLRTDFSRRTGAIIPTLPGSRSSRTGARLVADDGRVGRARRARRATPAGGSRPRLPSDPAPARPCPSDGHPIALPQHDLAVARAPLLRGPRVSMRSRMLRRW